MAFKQTGTCVLKTPLGKDVLIPVRVSVVERLTQPFEMQMDMVSHETVKPEDLVGKSVTVELRSGDDTFRHFNGVVSTFSQGIQDRKEILTYRAEVVPWVWLLGRSRNCRVWENKTAIEILESVLGDKKYGGGAYEFAKLGGEYEPIEYCVQYRESDLDFVTRMMESHGLGYSFRHEDGSHKLVIFDTSATLPDCPHFETLRYLRATTAGGGGGEVETWSAAQELPAGKLSINGYDFTNPSDDLLATTQSKMSIGGNSAYEIYECPSDYFQSKHGDRCAKLRMESVEAASHEIFGTSACPGLVVGTHFTLKQHHDDSQNNQRYLLTSVEHDATQSIGYEAGDGGGSSYQNTFTCLPERTCYRPPERTRKPRIYGIQTAVVVGPSGEEIHCDKYGRVRIQFHWDRNGKGDGTDVCWARCAQTVAGKKWGGIFIPRIDQEVVVQFLDGDPDRPLITGVVYNGEQMPPYELPDNKTQSGIKTRSSKGASASNFNEIRFEDKKGSEELFVQAEKDMNVNVKNDRSKTIGNDQNLSVGNNEAMSVGNDQTETIGNNQTLSVANNRSRSVGGNETVTVTMTRTHSVGINEAIQVGAAQEVTVGAIRSVTVGLNQDTKVGKDCDLSVGGSLTEKVDKDWSHKTGKKIVVDAGDEITIKTGKAKITMKKNGDIAIEGKLINVKGSGNIVMKGKKILEN